MKKIFTFVVLFVSIALFGCSDHSKDTPELPTEALPDNSSISQSLESSTPDETDLLPDTALIEATEDDLRQLFQQAYGLESSRSQDTEQIETEFAALEEIALEKSLSLPENVKTQYTEWRAAITKLLIEEDNAVLKAGYDEIIASHDRYSEGVAGLWDSSPGLFYADRIDFDGDGVMELLLVYLERKNGADGEPDRFVDVTVEVYGSGPDRTTVKYGEFTEQWDFGEKWLKLFDWDDKVYIGSYSWGGGTGLPHGYEYYGIENGALLEVSDLVVWGEYITEDTGDGSVEYVRVCSFTSFDEEISESQFENELGKYTERLNILEFWEGDVSFSSGVLPELPEFSLMLNGTAVALGNEIVANDGYLLAPADILKELGLAVYSPEQNITLISTKQDTVFIEYWDFLDIRFNEELQDWSTSMQMVGDILYVPVEAIAELFGAQVSRDRTSNTISIALDISEKVRMSQDEVQAIYEFAYEDALQILIKAGYDASDVWGREKSYELGESIWTIYWLPSGQLEKMCYANVSQRNGVISVGTMNFDPDADW